MARRAFVSVAAVAAAFTVAGCAERLPPTPLAQAARRGDVPQIDRLVAAGADVNEPANRKHWTPIVHAIHKRRKAAVVRLLEHGASLDGPPGRIALRMASGYGQPEIVRILLARRVEIPRTDGGAGALMTVAVGGAWDFDYEWSGCERHTEVVRMLLAHEPSLRSHLPNRLKRFPYSLASAVGTVARVYSVWFVRQQGCDELIRLMDR